MATGVLTQQIKRPARRHALGRLRRSPIGTTGAVLLDTVVFAAVAAPWLAPQSPLHLDPAIRLRAPSTAHWFGTDDFGRDVFSRVVYGSRVSLEIGAMVVASTAVVGVVGGLAASYFRAADNVIMWVVDAFLAIPLLPLAIALFAGS